MPRGKNRQSREQKLLDAVAYEASCLKEAGEPLCGLGPSRRYADAFDRYSEALRNLVAHTCAPHVADWSWDGYAGNFHFQWEFGMAVVQPGVKYDHDTRFIEMRCAAQLDPRAPLGQELARLRAEASHYLAMRGAVARWAGAVREQVSRETTGRAEDASLNEGWD